MKEKKQDSTDPFIDLSEALDFWLNNRLLAVHTAVPGTIQNYDPKNRSCDVQPTVNLPFPGGKFLEPPVIQSVPVCIPGSAQYMLDFEIPDGTTCEVHFSEAGIGQWLKGAKQPDADSPTRFKLTDAMVIPGLWQYGKVPKIVNGVQQKGDNVEHKAKGDHKTTSKTHTIAASGAVKVDGSEIVLNGGSNGVARINDLVLSTAADDPVFWEWIAEAGSVLAGLGVVAPVPTTLTGKIDTGSVTVKAGD
jgi:hypothetical protein